MWGFVTLGVLYVWFTCHWIMRDRTPKQRKRPTEARLAQIRENTDWYCTGVVSALAIWCLVDQWDFVRSTLENPRVWAFGIPVVIWRLWLTRRAKRVELVPYDGRDGWGKAPE